MTKEHKAKLLEGRKKAKLKRLDEPICSTDKVTEPISKQEIKKERLEYLKSLPFHGRFDARYKKAWAKKGRTPAVRMKCIDCMGFQLAEVDRCTIVTCPLYEYR